jgi:hypothetical protein
LTEFPKHRYLEKIRWGLLKLWQSVKEPSWFAGVGRAMGRRGKRSFRLIPAASTISPTDLPPEPTQQKI